jgi:predicted PurR-regulated permease PerM
MINHHLNNRDTVKKALPKISNSEFALAAGGFILFILLLYSTQALFSPFVLIVALVIVLYPIRAYPVVKNVMGLAIFLFAVWFCQTIQAVLAPFIISLFLAYLLHPVVTSVERWKVPRWTSTLFIILCALAIIILLVMGAVPIIIQQFGSILQTFSSMSAQITAWILNGDVFKTIHRYGVSNIQLRSFLTDSIAPRMEDVLKHLLQGTFGMVSEFNNVLTGIVNIVIIPFLTFYILKDFPLVKHRVKMLVPMHKREEAVVYYNYVDGIVGRYIRGTLIISLVDATLVSTSFWLIGIPYPMVLGVLSGIMFFLPYFGFLTMLVITGSVAAVSPEPAVLHVIMGLGVIVVLHVFENYILSPKIIGGRIGLHPVVLILSLFTFGYFFGFLGLVIAIPAAGSIVVIVRELERKRKQKMQEELFDLPVQ